MDEFHFLRPLWLAALVPLALLLWYGRRHHRYNAWIRVCDPRLLPHLLAGPDQSRSATLWLLAAGWLLATLALAGPTWDRTPQPLHQPASAQVLVLALTPAMRATDLAPSRLFRARLELQALVEAGDRRTALVVFAGQAYTVVPLTRDGATLRHLLPVLSPDLMPTTGHRPDLGLARAGELLAQAGAERGHVILLDDRATPSAVTAAAGLAAAGHRVSVLGVGTDRGAPVPAADGRLSGELTRLDHDSLAAVARAGGGRFVVLTPDRSDVRELLKAAPRPDRAGETATARALDWRERGPWLVLVLLPLAALAFRRGWLLLVPLLLPPPAPALDWNDLWQRPDQRAWQALQEGAPRRAQHLARDAWLRGTAAYRAGDYPAAAAAFAELDSVAGHYNRGNALARAGQLEAALDAYDAALARSPEHEDARHNRDLVQRLLQQRQNAARQQDRSERGDEAPPPTASPNTGEPPEPEDGRRDAATGPPKPGENGARAEAATDEADRGRAAPSSADTGEAAEALEQWLRRIPDDPAGLLRRKFLHQYQQQRGAGS